MADKKLKIIITVLVFFLLFGLGYYLFFRDSGFEFRPEGKKVEVVEEKIVFTRDPYLFRAGTDYRLGKRNEGEKVTEFQKGDYFGLSAGIEIEKEVTINIWILDENGLIIAENPISPLKKESSGPFGLCCALVPDKEGNYLLRLKINGTEEDIAFEVIP